MKSGSASTSSDHALKLVIAAPPEVDLFSFYQQLSRLEDTAVLRDYQLGTLAALRLLTSRYSDTLSKEVMIGVYALIGGQQYHAMQEVLLSNADGILVILDMRPSQRQASMQTIAHTIQLLQRQGIDLRKFPVVFLYHRTEVITAAVAEEWDQLLELERNQMPRFYGTRDFGNQSAQAMNALITRALEAMHEQVF